MAIYEDFDLDIQVGINENINKTPKYWTENCTKADSCVCTLDTCTGEGPRPCDR